jgi:hypothetical protein
MCGPRLRACAVRTLTRSPRVDHAQNSMVVRSPVARRQDLAGDLEGATGEVSSKEERAGAHQNGVPTLRRRKWCQAAAFNGGGIAPVVVDEGRWILQLEGDPGVRRWKSIEEWSGSEGRSLEEGRTSVMLGWSPARRRGSGGRKPTRWMPGRSGTSVRCSGMDGRDERRAGEKIFWLASGSSVLRGAVGRGAEGWAPRGGRVGEREGERGALCVAWSNVSAWHRCGSGPVVAHAGGGVSVTRTAWLTGGLGRDGGAMQGSAVRWSVRH